MLNINRTCLRDAQILFRQKERRHVGLARPIGIFSKLALSYVPEEGGPEQLYLSLGFKPTGEVDDGVSWA